MLHSKDAVLSLGLIRLVIDNIKIILKVYY